MSAAAFESINSSATLESIEAWSAEEEHAQMQRACDVSAMDIYDIKIKQCGSNRSIIVLPDIMSSPIPCRNTS
jgi:hypothetical protein